jgi:hypothetical protein
MLNSPASQRTVGRFAWTMAWVGLVIGQLHALARHNTVDGRGDLELPLTRFWSDPARSALRPLLDWGDPDLVYVTYGKIWLPVFVAFTLCAFVVHHRRDPAGFEKWAWRITLTGYVWACVGVFGDYWTQWTGTPNALLDISFVLGLPALLLVLIGSTLLGIALLRNRFTPRLPAWLLTITLPAAFVITEVTSMGNIALPVMFAFGILGHRIARSPAAVPLTEPAAL